MPEIQTPDVKEALRVRYKVREDFQLWLAEGIIPVAVVDDLTVGAPTDFSYPRNARGFVSSAAVVAENSIIVLRGVRNVGKIFRLTKAIISKLTAGNISLRVSSGSVSLPANTLVTTKDYTNQLIAETAANIPDLELGFGSEAAPTGVQVAQWDFPGRDTFQVDLNEIQGNNTWLSFVCGTQNEGLECSFEWSEYLLEDR